jgi:hypothetical protein
LDLSNSLRLQALLSAQVPRNSSVLAPFSQPLPVSQPLSTSLELSLELSLAARLRQLEQQQLQMPLAAALLGLRSQTKHTPSTFSSLSETTDERSSVA